jgi:hypothetical protein
MRFKQFLLVENLDAIDHQAILIAHKIHDMIDNSHVEREDDHISFNVGQLIKDSRFKNLVIKITNSPTEDTNENLIQISTDEELKRENIHHIITNKKNFNRLVEKLKQYIIHHHSFEDVSEDELTSHEKQKIVNDPASFNEKYDNLILAFKNSLGDLYKQVEELKKEKSNTGLHSKITSIENAIEMVIKNEVGSSFKEFQKIIYKLPEAAFISYLDGKQKKVLQARLHDFYEGYLKNILFKLKN